MSEMPTEGAQPAKTSVHGATFLGVGSMVGAGIFALLGEAATA
jgi:amino acid transporter